MSLKPVPYIIFDLLHPKLINRSKDLDKKRPPCYGNKKHTSCFGRGLLTRQSIIIWLHQRIEDFEILFTIFTTTNCTAQKFFLKIKITLCKSRTGYGATWSQLSPKSDISRHYSLNEKEGSLKAPCFFGVDFFHALKSNLSESRSFKINLLELLHLIKVIPMFLCQGFTTVVNHCNG